MKKNLFLMLATVFIGSSIQSQNIAKIKTHKALPYSAYLDRPSSGTAIPYSVPFVPYRGAAGLKGIILGSSGNLLTIISNESNMIATSNNLNTIIFIHRNDPLSFGGDVAMYRYDISIDGGNTWKRDIGPLNPSANGTEIKPNLRDTLHARYPQVALYNPKNNSDPDNAYLVYFGAYHNGSDGNDTWQGTNSGVGRLDDDTSTYTESFSYRNQGNVQIPKSLVQSSAKVYWSVDFGYDGSTVSDILVYRGIWSDVAKDVIWTLYNKLDPKHYLDNQGNANATSLHIGFDPTGKIGWIAFAGDLSGTGVLNPIFYKTVDGGNNWIGPEEVLLTPDVDSIAGIDSSKHLFLTSTSLVGKIESGDKFNVAGSSLWDGEYTVDSVNSTSVSVIETIADILTGDVFGDLLYGPMLSIYNSLDTLSTGIPTCTFENDFAVDMYGIPHYCSVIGGGDSYSIQTALSLNIWDIYYNAEDDKWDAKWLDNIITFRGDLYTDYSTDNRVQLSKTEDGSVIFFGWCDSDTLVSGGDNNSTPNFILKAWDVENKKLTPTINFTQGDPVYDGIAKFASIGTTVLQDTTGKYIIPVVIANPTFNDPLKSTEFHYLQGIEFSDSDFTIDNAPPVITLTGNQYVTIVKGSDYTDAGATAWDNVEGDISDSILTKNLVDTSALGTFLVTYDVTDNAGFAAEQVTRYVTIVSVADTIPPTITLAGFDTVEVEIGDAYIDSGATATDNVNGDITEQIVAWDNIDYDTVGTFWVKYTVADGAGNQSDTITRIVVLTDFTIPIITLVGDDNPYYHGMGRPWVDPGALAVDNLDGDISDKVVIAGTVDINTLGTYSLTYDISDANGNAAVQVTRKVEVVWPTGIEQQMLKQAINIYPNPSSGLFFIDVTLPEVKNCKISLLNILGEKVSMIETSNPIQKQFLINVSDQPNGIYFVKIETEKAQVTKKLVLNK